MLRHDVDLLFSIGDDGLYIWGYLSVKDSPTLVKVSSTIYNISDVYKVHLTTGRTFCCSIDQILLTNKGEKSIFELMGEASTNTTKTYTLIGTKGLLPKTTRIEKLDKNSVFEIVLENPNCYYEVAGIFVKGRHIEGTTKGAK